MRYIRGEACSLESQLVLFSPGLTLRAKVRGNSDNLLMVGSRQPQRKSVHIAELFANRSDTFVIRTYKKKHGQWVKRKKRGKWVYEPHEAKYHNVNMDTVASCKRKREVHRHSIASSVEVFR